jgi:Holliday junction resolvasome RuvABC endonuclease subunit
MSLQTNYLVLYGSKGYYTFTSFDPRYNTLDEVIENVQKKYNPNYIAIKETFIHLSDLYPIDINQYTKGMMIFDD